MTNTIKLALTLALCAVPVHAADVIAYVFPHDKPLNANTIDAAHLTRINYAFANVSEDGRVVEGSPADAQNLAALLSLKSRNPNLRVLISVGGWTWSGRFSDAVLTSKRRKLFARSALGLVRKYNLDGLDIDWEYPGLPGLHNTHRPEDKQNYTAMLKELRKQFGPKLLLSIATGAQTEVLQHTEMRKVARYVDTVNLMSYDYYEPEDDKVTGNHAPLFTNPADPKHISADESVREYLAAGVPANKLVLGIPFYGHAWTHVPNLNFGLFQPGTDAHMNADFNALQPLLQPGSPYTRHWDAAASVPFLYDPASGTFISYEDADSIAAKCRYVQTHHLAGVMFWDYASDANGTLLKAITNALGANRLSGTQ